MFSEFKNSSFMATAASHGPIASFSQTSKNMEVSAQGGSTLGCRTLNQVWLGKYGRDQKKRRRHSLCNCSATAVPSNLLLLVFLSRKKARMVSKLSPSSMQATAILVCLRATLARVSHVLQACGVRRGFRRVGSCFMP